MSILGAEYWMTCAREACDTIEFLQKDLDALKSDLRKLVEEIEDMEVEPEGYPWAIKGSHLVDRYWAGRIKKIIGGE